MSSGPSDAPGDAEIPSRGWSPYRCSQSARRLSVASVAATCILSVTVCLLGLADRTARFRQDDVSSSSGRGAPVNRPGVSDLPGSPVSEASGAGAPEVSHPAGERRMVPEPTELVLSGVAEVQGAAWTSDGTPVEGCRVRLTTTLGEHLGQAETDFAGRFVFEDLPPGRGYRLRLRPEGAQREEVVALVLEPGLQHVDIVLGRGGRGRLGFELIDTEGLPVPNLILSARSATGSTRRRGVTDGDGRLRLDSVPSGSLVVESLARPRLTVSGLGLGAGGETDAVVIAALGEYSVDGVVVDHASGSSLIGVRVSAVWTRRSGGVRSSVVQITRTDGAGRFTLNGLGAGHFEISAVAAGYQRDEVTVEVPSEQAVELRLPAVR